MKNEEMYRNVYDNWYCVSCAKSNETPVSFEIYFKRALSSEVEIMQGYLLEGRTP